MALHRIIDGDFQSFTFKGDNNESIDPLQPGADELVGRAVLHIPQVGIWLKILTSPPVLGLIAFTLIASGGTAVTTRKLRRKRRTAVSRHISDSPAASLSATGLSVGTLPPSPRIPAAITAVVGLLGAGLGIVAWAGPLDTPSAAEVRSGTRMDFSYTAEVGQSAAYDGTTATSPDPVFRTLANNVDVNFAYQGDPGTIAVDAELSTPSGWNSTVPLSSSQPFTGNSHEGTVTLDLKSIEAKAEAAAAVTGLSGTPVTIALIPRVTTASNTEFAPELQLSLTRCNSP